MQNTRSDSDDSRTFNVADLDDTNLGPSAGVVLLVLVLLPFRLIGWILQTFWNLLKHVQSIVRNDKPTALHRVTTFNETAPTMVEETRKKRKAEKRLSATTKARENKFL